MLSKGSINPYDDALVKMSHILARKGNSFTVLEQKLFLMAVSQVENADDKGLVKLSKQDVFEKLHIDDTNVWTRYKTIFYAMRKKTRVTFETEETWVDGDLIYKIISTKHYFHVYFDPEYLPLLKNLKKEYTIMALEDVLKFESKFSLMLYQFIRSLNKHPKFDNYYDFSTSELKEVFGLSKDDYCKKDGKFDRFNFEKYTLKIAIDEINQKSFLLKDMKYEKHKKGNKVSFYRIYFKNQQLPNLNSSVSVSPTEIIEDGDYLNYQLFRECLSYLEPITNAQIREIYELATECVEQSNTFEIDMYKYLSSKITQLKAYNQPVTSKRGLIKTFIRADINKKFEEIYG